MKDLLVYAEALDGELYYYKDEKDNEIDAIIELSNGKWAAIEIKLSLTLAIESIGKLNDNIRRLKMDGDYKEPVFKAIITNGEEMMVAKDGTYIIPHTLLRPW